MNSIRNYKDSDYSQLKRLYEHGEWYGGQFDEARDGREKITKIISEDPEAVIVYEQDGKLLGAISLIEDGRVAWLFRFVVEANNVQIAKELYDKATKILKRRGHSQVLVYTQAGNTELNSRYEQLGMKKGNDFTAYWQDI